MKPQRNEPCPCGSGIKFKKCCGHPFKLSEAQREQREAYQKLIEARREQQRKKHEEIAEKLRNGESLSGFGGNRHGSHIDLAALMVAAMMPPNVVLHRAKPKKP